MRGIIQRMPAGGGRASIAYVIDALRDEMLAHNFLTSYQFSLATVTPEERWQDWLKSNDRIALEVAPFPAETFLVDVPEPTDAELLAFVQPPDNPDIDYLKRDPQPDFRFGGLNCHRTTPALRRRARSMSSSLKRTTTRSSQKSRAKSPTRKSPSITKRIRIRYSSSWTLA